MDTHAYMYHTHTHAYLRVRVCVCIPSSFFPTVHQRCCPQQCHFLMLSWEPTGFEGSWPAAPSVPAHLQPRPRTLPRGPPGQGQFSLAAARCPRPLGTLHLDFIPGWLGLSPALTQASALPHPPTSSTLPPGHVLSPIPHCPHPSPGTPERRPNHIRMTGGALLFRTDVTCHKPSQTVPTAYSLSGFTAGVRMGGSSGLDRRLLIHSS